MELTELFKAMADNTRIRIVNILKNGGTLCGCDLESILDISQVNLSRHTAKLKSAKIVKAEKKAQWVYFTLNEELLNKYTFLREAFERNIYEDVLKKDLEKMNIYLKNKKNC